MQMQRCSASGQLAWELGFLHLDRVILVELRLRRGRLCGLCVAVLDDMPDTTSGFYVWGALKIGSMRGRNPEFDKPFRLVQIKTFARCGVELPDGSMRPRVSKHIWLLVRCIVNCCCPGGLGLTTSGPGLGLGRMSHGHLRALSQLAPLATLRLSGRWGQLLQLADVLAPRCLSRKSDRSIAHERFFGTLGRRLQRNTHSSGGVDAQTPLRFWPACARS